MKVSVPVLYYHRIGAPDPIHLSTPADLFDRQLAFLHRRGLRSITMGQLVRHVTGEDPLSYPAFAVTFDDGFRDNLTEAFPVLRKHGCRAAVFPVGGLIRPDEAPPQVPPRDFNAAHQAARQGDRGDFLSRAEMREMLASGLVEFHSHGFSHRQVFTGNRVEGAYPDTDAHWGILSAYGRPLPAGSWPVFPRGPGLVHPAWEPDLDRISAAGRDWAAAARGKGQAAVTLPRDWFRIESPSEFERRVRDDLRASRALFADLHPPGPHLICWPWGASHDDLRRWAREEGYQGALATTAGPNLPGDDPFRICRFPVKKGDLARFALGIWLRSSPALARAYGLVRSWGQR